MSRPESKPRSILQLVQALQATRDNARVRLHLLSLEAKGRFGELEGKLLELERKLQAGGERAAAEANAAVDELTQGVSDLFRTVEGAGSLRVRDLMTRAPVACSASDSLSRAAQLMWEHDFGTLPVVDDENRVIGIVTDRDVCMAAYTRGREPGAIRVEETMARNVCVALPDDTLEDAARLMGEQQVRRLPVVEGGRLVGVLAIADLARFIKSSDGGSLPLCVTLARALGAISEDRRETSGRAAAE